MYSFNGCPHHCPGCHNPETWSSSGGELFNIDDTIINILEYINENGIQRNLSILGGEPLWRPNAEFTAALAAAAREKYPNIKICVWTGYLYEDIKDDETINNLFQSIDYLIDGPYRQRERDITLKWRGSRNQRVIDIKQTLEKGDIILYG